MKYLKISVCLLMFFALFAGCKKDNEENEDAQQDVVLTAQELLNTCWKCKSANWTVNGSPAESDFVVGDEVEFIIYGASWVKNGNAISADFSVENNNVLHFRFRATNEVEDYTVTHYTKESYMRMVLDNNNVRKVYEFDFLMHLEEGK